MTNPISPAVSSAGVDPETRAVARFQRLLLVSIVANVGVFAVVKLVPIPGLIVLAAYLAVAVFQLWCVWSLGSSLKVGLLPLWMIGMFAPCVNLILLLVLNARATGHLQSRGVRVGLLGARL